MALENTAIPATGSQLHQINNFANISPIGIRALRKGRQKHEIQRRIMQADECSRTNTSWWHNWQGQQTKQSSLERWPKQNERWENSHIHTDTIWQEGKKSNTNTKVYNHHVPHGMKRKSASTGDVGVNQPLWRKEEKKKSNGQDGEAWEGESSEQI